MRVFSASLATEINTFSPIPTDLASFKEDSSRHAPRGAASLQRALGGGAA